MLEKLAEMVREQTEEVVVNEKSHYNACYLCELESANGFFPRCLANEAVCNEARKKRDLKLASCAVQMVVGALPSWERYRKAEIRYLECKARWGNDETDVDDWEQVATEVDVSMRMVMDELTTLIEETRIDSKVPLEIVSKMNW